MLLSTPPQWHRALTALLSLLVSLAGMRDHPPIPVTDLADNIDRLKANDGLKFSQEYEVSVRACRAAGAERCWPGPPWRGLGG